jgi:hypothetical protein
MLPEAAIPAATPGSTEACETSPRRRLEASDINERTEDVAKFILLYNGPATPVDNMTPEQMQEVMGKWQSWMEGVGSAMTDMGAPMANGETIVDDGSARPATELAGYTMIEADDMAAAKSLVDGHPFLSGSTGGFAVEIHELMPIPGM